MGTLSNENCNLHLENDKICDRGEDIAANSENIVNADCKGIFSANLKVSPLDDLRMTSNLKERFDYTDIKTALKDLKDTSWQTVDSIKSRGYLFPGFSYVTRSVTDTFNKFKIILTSLTNQSLSSVSSIEESTVGHLESKKQFQLPWLDTEDVEDAKQQILSLSLDRKIFLRSPPPGVFKFDLNVVLPVAELLLKEDNNLAKMRFEIVPKFIKEEDFWKNYFYRVSLIQRASRAQKVCNQNFEKENFYATSNEKDCSVCPCTNEVTTDKEEQNSISNNIDKKKIELRNVSQSNERDDNLQETKELFETEKQESLEFLIEEALQECSVDVEENNDAEWENDVEQLIAEIEN